MRLLEGEQGNSLVISLPESRLFSTFYITFLLIFLRSRILPNPCFSAISFPYTWILYY